MPEHQSWFFVGFFSSWAQVKFLHMKLTQLSFVITNVTAPSSSFWPSLTCKTCNSLSQSYWMRPIEWDLYFNNGFCFAGKTEFNISLKYRWEIPGNQTEPSDSMTRHSHPPFHPTSRERAAEMDVGDVAPSPERQAGKAKCTLSTAGSCLSLLPSSRFPVTGTSS